MKSARSIWKMHVSVKYVELKNPGLSGFYSLFYLPILGLRIAVGRVSLPGIGHGPGGSELGIIHKDTFFSLLFSNRNVAPKFINILSNKVVEKEEQLLNLAYNSGPSENCRGVAHFEGKIWNWGWGAIHHCHISRRSGQHGRNSHRIRNQSTFRHQRGESSWHKW